MFTTQDVIKYKKKSYFLQLPLVIQFCFDGFYFIIRCIYYYTIYLYFWWTFMHCKYYIFHILYICFTVTVPRLMEFDWRVDLKMASGKIARMSEPTCILNLKVNIWYIFTIYVFCYQNTLSGDSPRAFFFVSCNFVSKFLIQ